jgi:aminomethyltransferase
MNKEFIGKQKLQALKEVGTPRTRVGMVTERRVIPRRGFSIVRQGKAVGTVTSGTLSPLLNTGIAMGYVEKEVGQEGALVEVHVRDRLEKVKIVKPPFYDTTRYGYSRKT